jgi:hypothetical protein
MTTAAWATEDYAAHMAAQLAAMPVMGLTAYVRDSQGRRWSVLRLSAHTWQVSWHGMTYVRCLVGAVQVMEEV